MIDTMSRAHDENVAGWILTHFDSANKDKIVRNPTNQGKNLKCPANESKEFGQWRLTYNMMMEESTKDIPSRHSFYTRKSVKYWRALQA